jgi:hypothetical protein
LKGHPGFVVPEVAKVHPGKPGVYLVKPKVEFAFRKDNWEMPKVHREMAKVHHEMPKDNSEMTKDESADPKVDPVRHFDNSVRPKVLPPMDFVCEAQHSAHRK